VLQLPKGPGLRVDVGRSRRTVGKRAGSGAPRRGRTPRPAETFPSYSESLQCLGLAIGTPLSMFVRARDPHFLHKTLCRARPIPVEAPAILRPVANFLRLRFQTVDRSPFQPLKAPIVELFLPPLHFGMLLNREEQRVAKSIVLQALDRLSAGRSA